MIFYEIKEGKEEGEISWECVNRFDANNPEFQPEWKKKNGKVLWKLHQNDMIELNTPEEWKSYIKSERCIARVKKMKKNKLGIDINYDARMGTPSTGNPDYMAIKGMKDGEARLGFFEKVLSFYTQHKVRKVELTSFGKIKRRHRKLWHGKKAEG